MPSLASPYYIDVALEAEMLALEITGRRHEDEPGLFQSDRWRQHHLVLQGWRVLRYAWTMLKQHPQSVIHRRAQRTRPHNRIPVERQP